jgi:phosphoribosylanthranilate isomerase
MYLAGGLSAENVAEAIEKVQPFAVDACSLLEKSKGVKNAEKVRDFIFAVK